MQKKGTIAGSGDAGKWRRVHDGEYVHPQLRDPLACGGGRSGAQPDRPPRCEEDTGAQPALPLAVSGVTHRPRQGPTVHTQRSTADTAPEKLSPALERWC